MSDWEAELSDDDREVWDEFVESVRRDALEKIADSSVVLSLMPRGEVDIKYAVELGLAIMLDKPLLVVAHPDAIVPRHLELVADNIVRADLDTAEGREHVAAVIQGWDAIQLG